MHFRKQAPGLDCPLDHEYSEEEWRAFVACAREGMVSGGRLHNDFEVEIDGHDLSSREVEKAVRQDACLVLFETDLTPRLGLWDPRSELFLVGTVPDGLVLTAFPLEGERAERYLQTRSRVRWLKR